MQRKEIKKDNIFQLTTTLILVILLTIVSNYFFTRIDLTSDKRFTLSSHTKTMLKDLNDIVYFKVYLDGDLPAGFMRLKKATREILEEFKVYGTDNIQFEFIDPAESPNRKTRNEIFRQLYKKGLEPTNLNIKEKDGSNKQKIIFPGIIVSYRNKEVPVNILKNNIGYSSEGNINASIQALEYELTFAIHKATTILSPRIAFIAGHGELDSLLTGDLAKSLSDYYTVKRVRINSNLYSLRDTFGINRYKLIIIAKPTKKIPEKDKFIIDQYIMYGGKVLWLVDAVNISIDSLAYSQSTLGFINNANLDDMLFKYGVRINPNLIQDIRCSVIPVNTAMVGQKPKFTPTPWIYFPFLEPSQKNSITRNLDLIKTQFVSSIDTVGENADIKKTIILTSSKYSRTVNAPILVDLSMIRKRIEPRVFTKSFLPAGVLLEGRFKSLFTNRISPVIAQNKDIGFKTESKNTQMIVFSDGDIIRNLVTGGVGKNTKILPLGYDRYTKQTFGNKELLINCVNYLCGMNDLLESRNKEYKLRLLDRPRIMKERLKWQLINLILPVILVIATGLLFNYLRKRKYLKKV
jgi:ABC-2 type transport system permease protein